MPPQVGIVADDLTGAADTGVAFLAAGLTTIVSWPDIHDVSVLEQADVVSFDAGSRAVDRERAGAITARIVSRFREIGIPTLYKKIDSTLRGHIGAELLAALHAWHPQSLAIVAPAFPRTGRTTVNGYQCVDGVTLPGRASLPELLETIGIRTRRSDLSFVRSGGLESLFRDCQQTAGAVVCDAETDEDLEVIARAGLRLQAPVVWVGSGGLARAMAAEGQMTASARQRAATGASISAPPVPVRLPRDFGSVLIVVGSRSTIARAQAEALAEAGSHRIDVPVHVLRSGMTADGSRIAGEIEARLRAGDDVVTTLEAVAMEDGGVETEDPRLVERLGELLAPEAAAVGGLILTGGATAVALLRAWGTTALRIQAELDPGVVLSETVGARRVPVVTKAGAFGDRGTLTRAREQLRKDGPGTKNQEQGTK